MGSLKEREREREGGRLGYNGRSTSFRGPFETAVEAARAVSLILGSRELLASRLVSSAGGGRGGGSEKKNENATLGIHGVAEKSSITGRRRMQSSSNSRPFNPRIVARSDAAVPSFNSATSLDTSSDD